jgi:dimeric dUTPase (all-alpha-NTP-PPase superfamily)
MFKRQLINNYHWVSYDGLTDVEQEKMTKEYVLLTIDEMFELLREVNYKQHIMRRKPLIRTNILEELVDAFKYLLSIALVYGFTPEEFVQAFFDKSDVVDRKWEEERVEWGDKLLAVDIDGVLADYVTGYSDYLFSQNMIMGRLENQSSYNIAEAYGISKDVEEKAKRDFQESGGFRWLPVYSGAEATLKWARELGYKIALVSARPYLEMRRIHADTIFWLHNNNIPYDAIYWGKDKADIIFSNLYPIKPTWFIEDRDKHAIELANENIPVLLLDKPYNQGVKHKNIIRVNGWGDIADIIGEG